MLNAHWACQKAILYFTEFTPVLAATVESLVADIRYTVLINFPIIAQRSEGVPCFHRVVGLVVRCTVIYCRMLVCNACRPSSEDPPASSGVCDSAHIRIVSSHYQASFRPQCKAAGEERVG